MLTEATQDEGADRGYSGEETDQAAWAEISDRGYSGELQDHEVPSSTRTGGCRCGSATSEWIHLSM